MDPTAFTAPLHDMSIYNLLQMREAARRPIRVGVVGAGATGRAIALQLGTPVAGIRLAGIANRTPAHAERSFREAGIEQWQSVDTVAAADQHIARGVPVLTQDAQVLTRSREIDIVIEVTGTVSFAASVVL